MSMNGIIFFAAAAALAGFDGTNPVARKHFNPGIPVMVSENLSDWRIASCCY